MIRDETSKVLAKSRRSLDVLPRSIPQTLHPSIWDQAKLFFISKNILVKPSPFEYMSHFYPGHHGDGYVSTTVMAIMLAYCYRFTRSDTVAAQAAAAYGRALHRTQKALHLPETAAHDEMLLTVLLLYLTEKLMVPYQDSNCHNSSHIQGAVALVKVRGQAGFQDVISQRIFAQLMGNVLIDSIQKHEEAPPELTFLLRIISPTDPMIQFKWTFLNIMADYAALRSAIRKCLVRDSQVINKARELCENLRKVCETLATVFEFRTISSSVASIIPIHRYENDIGRRLWNMVRVFYIILQEMVLDYCHKVSKAQQNDMIDFDIAEQISDSISSISSLSLDICASVPQHSRPGCKQKSTGGPRLIYDVSDLVYPLYIVGRSPACPLNVRDWSLATIQYFADGGVEKPFIPSGFPCQDMDEDVWTVHSRICNVMI